MGDSHTSQGSACLASSLPPLSHLSVQTTQPNPRKIDCSNVCPSYMCTMLQHRVTQQTPVLYIQWSSWDNIYIASMIKTTWRGAPVKNLHLDTLNLLQITVTVDMLNIWKAALCSCDILTSGVKKGTGLKLWGSLFFLFDHQLHPGQRDLVGRRRNSTPLLRTLGVSCVRILSFLRVIKLSVLIPKSPTHG